MHTLYWCIHVPPPPSSPGASLEVKFQPVKFQPVGGRALRWSVFSSGRCSPAAVLSGGRAPLPTLQSGRAANHGRASVPAAGGALSERANMTHIPLLGFGRLATGMPTERMPWVYRPPPSSHWYCEHDPVVHGALFHPFDHNVKLDARR